MTDPVNHPPHYTTHSSGVECIKLAESMDFCPGNAFKYVWRFRDKGGRVDLDKALWYIEREIAFRERERGDDVDRATAIARVMAHETDPRVAMILWCIFVGDASHGKDGHTMLRQARMLTEELIHETESTTR